MSNFSQLRLYVSMIICKIKKCDMGSEVVYCPYTDRSYISCKRCGRNVSLEVGE